MEQHGFLTFEELKRKVRDKEIHTVTLGFADHYGRLMGKRFDSNFFVQEVATKGGHSCNYLLACDLKMDVPDEIANWESGYGDYHMIPDLNSIRQYWIDGHAFVFADLYTHDH